MAMVQCPNCGREISDKAKRCIYCGKVFIEEEIVNGEIKCGECGKILSKTDEICPNCGCPIENEVNGNEEKLPQVREVTAKATKKSKKIMISIVIIALLCVSSGIGYKMYRDYKEEQNEKESYNEYIANLERVKARMLNGERDAEELCDLTLKVWGNAISKEHDSETDMYTTDGYSWYDFNTALAYLYDDIPTTLRVTSIEANQNYVKDLMKKLQNPPEELSKCYDTVSELYKAYKQITDLAISPSGSYKDYGENKSGAVSDFTVLSETLDNQIPEKIEMK